MTETKLKNFNYLIQELPETNNGSSRELITKIATFFARLDKKIIIITKQKLSAEAVKLFETLTGHQRRLITLIYCKNYQAVLDKLLEIDANSSVSRVIIVESLHQWYDEFTAFEKIPSIYSTIIAATQDLINTNSRILKETCFSFITSSPDDWPKHIIELFYDSPIIAGENCLTEVFELHKKLR